MIPITKALKAKALSKSERGNLCFELQKRLCKNKQCDEASSKIVNLCSYIVRNYEPVKETDKVREIYGLCYKKSNDNIPLEEIKSIRLGDVVNLIYPNLDSTIKQLDFGYGINRDDLPTISLCDGGSKISYVKVPSQPTESRLYTIPSSKEGVCVSSCLYIDKYINDCIGHENLPELLYQELASLWGEYIKAIYSDMFLGRPEQFVAKPYSYWLDPDYNFLPRISTWGKLYKEHYDYFCILYDMNKTLTNFKKYIVPDKGNIKFTKEDKKELLLNLKDKLEL